MYELCQDELCPQTGIQEGCAAVLQSKIWPSILIAPNSRNIELIFLRHELFSPSSLRSIKQAGFKFPNVSSS